MATGNVKSFFIGLLALAGAHCGIPADSAGSPDPTSSTGDTLSTSGELDNTSKGQVQTVTSGDAPEAPTEATTSTGQAPVCGDGIVDGGEECDDGNQDDTDACTNTCTAAKCGDTFVQAFIEECDDGDQDNDDECTVLCKAPLCGDGLLNNHEECDDGNQDDSDACTNTCNAPSCGDGIVNGDEVCDDGVNMGEYGGCYQCTSKSPSCGDGNVQYDVEMCDSGNGLDGFMGLGCTESCYLDFSEVTQMACHGTCSWAGPEGCDQADADVFCKLLTNNQGAVATKFLLSSLTDSGGFSCADAEAPILLNGVDPRHWFYDVQSLLGGIGSYPYQETGVATSHGPTKYGIQAQSLICKVP